jgi:hypothetical protein
VVRNDDAEAPGTTQCQCGGSKEDSTTSRAPGRLTAVRALGKFLAGNFWQPCAMSESFRGLGFAKVAQQFIYRRITVATDIDDVSRAVAIENHSSNGRVPSAACC